MTGLHERRREKEQDKREKKGEGGREKARVRESERETRIHPEAVGDIHGSAINRDRPCYI